MTFSKKFSKVIHSFHSLFDMVAYCYDYLLNNTRVQSAFIGKYIKVNDDVPSNPNHNLMLRFVDEIKDFLLDGEIVWDFNSIYLLSVRYEKKIVDFLENDDIIIPFYIIKGIDMYLEEYDYNIKEMEPLNSCLNDKYAVFLRTKQCLMDFVKKKKDYHNRIENCEIRNEFKNFIIVEKKEIPNYFDSLRMVTLIAEPRCIENIVNGKTIKIASIPLPKDRYYDFEYSVGACFSIKYNKQASENMRTNVEKLLEEAIALGANIIIFPEYACSPEIKQTIKSKLETLYKVSKEKLNELLLVVSGSEWTQDDNNVCSVFNKEGKIIAETYKNAPFRTQKKGLEYIEDLSTPGQKISLIRIKGLGVVQISICRDISNDSVSSLLAKIFSPQFLIVPAWSPSLKNAFENQLMSITNHNHETCGIVCNACSAIRSDFINIGLVLVPQLFGSLVKGKIYYVQRGRRCDNCKKNGCVFICSFNFSGSKNGNDDVCVVISS